MILIRLLASIALVEGWLSSVPLSPSFSLQRSTRMALHESSNSGDNAFFDDEECYDLCEFDDDDETTTFAAPPAPKKDKVAVGLQKISRQERDRQAEKDRMRLEMSYEMFRSSDDCDLEDISTCSETCAECSGSGHSLCRGCAGTKQVSLIGATSKMSCPVCNSKGVEECNKCHGSGRIAPWTELADFEPEF
jgi:DnaJ-class molecular chaperone